LPLPRHCRRRSLRCLPTSCRHNLRNILRRESIRATAAAAACDASRLAAATICAISCAESIRADRRRRALAEFLFRIHSSIGSNNQKLPTESSGDSQESKTQGESSCSASPRSWKAHRPLYRQVSHQE
jgi:hypothetical protein